MSHSELCVCHIYDIKGFDKSYRGMLYSFQCLYMFTVAFICGSWLPNDTCGMYTMVKADVVKCKEKKHRASF